MNNSISSITSLLQTKSNNASAPKKDSGLDIEDFLSLLVAQMQNQDPLGGDSSGGGSSNMDYISQLAQFTMLKQLSALNDEMTANKAYNLIGKYVYIDNQAEDGKDSGQIFGKVDGVVTKDGEQCVVVGGQAYGLSKVSAVVNDTSGTDEQIINSADLIGKQVTATVMGEDNVAKPLTGVVSKVTVQDGVISLVIGDQTVPLSDITEITTADTTDDSTQSA